MKRLLIDLGFMLLQQHPQNVSWKTAAMFFAIGEWQLGAE
jgi:hypothetical protein